MDCFTLLFCTHSRTPAKSGHGRCKRTLIRGPENRPHQGAGLDPQGTTEHLRASHTKGLGLTLRGPQST
eukprot:365736-Chlamydomonas_euryale.AAC.9